MTLKKCFVLGGVGLVKGRVRESQGAMIQITREINPFLVESNTLENAPFSLLNGCILYGNRFDPFKKVGPINRTHDELPFSVEVEMLPLKLANKETVHLAFINVIIPALLAIADKFEFPNTGILNYAKSQGVSTEADE